MLNDFQNSFTDRLSGKFAIRSLWNIAPHLRCVTTLPCEIFMFENCLLLLKKRYQNFFMQQFCTELLTSFVASKQSSMWTTWSDVWLTCGLTCSRTSLTMQLTSGGSVCTPMFESEEDILSMHRDSRTILINAANYCYHLIVKIYHLTRCLFQTNASFLALMFRTVV